MERWQRTLSESITSLGELARFLPIHIGSLRPVVALYPLRITSYYFSLIRERGDPIWRQCIPDIREIEEDHLSPDPLDEEGFSPVPNLLHRYPDRAVLLVSSSCPTFCRFCTRKNRLINGKRISLKDSLDGAIRYLEKSPMVQEVILSGGDPLLLSDEELDRILAKLKGIPHLQVLRINTRIPVTFPERITSGLCRMLKQHHPLYVNTHFNHPLEITRESSEACAMLADAGIPLGNQTVLLREVNDDPEVMKELMKKLLTLRVRPYYIHQMDQVKGTNHFRTSVERGIRMMRRLRGHISGMAIPYYVIDLPGGKGKVPILPEDVRREGKTLYLRNYLGEVVEYPDDGGGD